MLNFNYFVVSLHAKLAGRAKNPYNTHISIAKILNNQYLIYEKIYFNLGICNVCTFIADCKGRFSNYPY